MANTNFQLPVFGQTSPAEIDAWLNDFSAWMRDIEDHFVNEHPAGDQDNEPAPAPVPAPVEPAPSGDVTVGEGADVIVLNVSQDQFGDANAQFSITVDGKQIGDVFTASALHGSDTDQITLKGDFGPGEHSIGVTFLNDAYEGTDATDRNLHVDSVSLNGSEVSGSSFWSAGTQDFNVGNAVSETPTAPAPAEPVPDAGSGNDIHAGYEVVVSESFDDGLGMFSRAWGPGIDTSVDGQLTIWTDANDADSGAMVPPTDASAGFGYGLYEFTLETQGTIGVYALTWPATDVWPGPELDLLEITPEGEGYSTIHFDDNGGNGFTSYSLGETDVSALHTYSMEWQPGQLTGYVDGVEMWTTDQNVPLDFAHGGENTAPGIGAQTFWNEGAMDGQNSITIYDFSYSALV